MKNYKPSEVNTVIVGAGPVGLLNAIGVSFPYRRANTKQHSAVDPNYVHQQAV